MNTQRRQTSSILAKSRMRSYLVSTALTAAGLLAMSPAASAQNWTDHVAEQPGGISIDTSVPNTTNIDQHLVSTSIWTSLKFAVTATSMPDGRST